MSRTVKPVIPGTHRYATRSDRCSYICCTPRPTMSEAEAIADHEFLSIEIDTTEVPTYPTLREMDEAFLDVFNESADRMAQWEIALLEGVEDERTVWTTSTREQQMLACSIIEAGDDAYFEDRDQYDEDLEGDYAGAWLLGTVDEMSEAGHGITVEGPTDRSSVRASGYVRVYELARDLDVRTGDLVAWLKRQGEYVAGPLAYVAKPVADAVHTCDLTALARRTQTEQEVSDSLLDGIRSTFGMNPFNALRPGAPRF